MSTYPMWVFARESGSVIAVNDAAVVAYGGTRDELLDVTVFEVFPRIGPNAANILDDRHEEILWIGPWIQRRKDGGTSWAEVGIIEARAALGAPRATTMVFFNQHLDAASPLDCAAHRASWPNAPGL